MRRHRVWRTELAEQQITSTQCPFPDNLEIEEKYVDLFAQLQLAQYMYNNNDHRLKLSWKQHMYDVLFNTYRIEDTVNCTDGNLHDDVESSATDMVDIPCPSNTITFKEHLTGDNDETSYVSSYCNMWLYSYVVKESN